MKGLPYVRTFNSSPPAGSISASIVLHSTIFQNSYCFLHFSFPKSHFFSSQPPKIPSVYPANPHSASFSVTCSEKLNIEKSCISLSNTSTSCSGSTNKERVRFNYVNKGNGRKILNNSSGTVVVDDVSGVNMRRGEKVRFFNS